MTSPTFVAITLLLCNCHNKSLVYDFTRTTSASPGLESELAEVLFRHKRCVHVSISAQDFVSRKFQLTMFPFLSQSPLGACKLVSLGETEPEYVMWHPEDIQPIGQEQQQSKPEMCVRVGVKPSALCFLLYRSTPLGQHYLL